MLVPGSIQRRFSQPPTGRTSGHRGGGRVAGAGRKRLAWVAFVAVAFAAAVPMSLALMSDAATSDGAFTAATLVPPTGVAATGGSNVSLSWAASTSTGATGYAVERATALAGPYVQIGTATPLGTTSYLDSPAAGTYWYRLSTFVSNWVSPTTTPVSAVVTSTSTGEQPCLAASNAADTGGDDDGYQTNPGNGCASDGLLAVDAATGITGRSTSCTNTANDRHRFWGNAFGLPGTATAITGITVRADVGQNNNGGTSVFCVELSWDGGTTWTTAKSATLSGTAVATYTLGATTDTWGRTWTAGEFSTTSFRVRVIDATSQPSKDYCLDYLAVMVDYAP